MKSIFAFLFALALLTAGCKSAPKPVVKPVQKADLANTLVVGLCIGGAVMALVTGLGSSPKTNAPAASHAPASHAPAASTAYRAPAAPAARASHAPAAPTPVRRKRKEPLSPITVTVIVSPPENKVVTPPRSASIAPPQPKPVHTPKHFVIDGANVCRSYDRGGFKLETLLTLVSCILADGNTFECYFDASTRYAAERAGSIEARDLYLSLLQRYTVLFREVPAGEPADETILLRADRTNCAVISNDLFKKVEDQHAIRFPWINKLERMVRGRQYQNQLVVTRLGIDRPIPATLDGALNEFEATLARFGSAVATLPTSSCEMQMAA